MEGGEGPQQWGDFVLVTAAFLAAIPFVLANVVICMHRKRRYFRVEGVDLILASSAAGLIWIVASFVVNEHFKRDSFLLSRCSFWTFWLQVCFGFSLWLVCLGIRLHRLQLLCMQQEKLSSCVVWLKYVPLLLLPAVVFSVVATKYAGLKYDRYEGVCSIQNSKWRLISFFLVPLLYFSFILALALRLRKQRQTDYICKLEFRHTMEYAAVAFVIYLLFVTTYINKTQKFVAGRVFLTFCVCTLVYSHFWLRMGYPVYLCLFRPETEMDRYEEELRRSGARCLETLRLFSMLSNRNQNVQLGSLHVPADGPGLTRAIEEARAESRELKARAEKLELQKRELEEEASLLSRVHRSPLQGHTDGVA